MFCSAIVLSIGFTWLFMSGTVPISPDTTTSTVKQNNNPAGFEINETRYYKVSRLSTTHEGSITWDGSVYHVSGYFESAICSSRSDGYRYGTIEGTYKDCVYTEMWPNDLYKLDEVKNTFPRRLLRQMIESVTYR